VADGAHNADSISKLNQAMYDLFYKHPLIVVLGIFKDKDLQGMVRELGTDRSNVFGPYIEKVIVTHPNNPRAADPVKLAELVQAHGVEVEIQPNITDALKRAEELALEGNGESEREPVVLVTGSLYTVAEAREYYGLALDLSGEE
jgi:dihydrofolate synthase/folylpolyglutamate synthase